MRPTGPGQRRTERMALLSELRGEVMVYQPMVLTEVSRDLAKTDTPALARTNGRLFTKTNFILARSNLPPVPDAW